MRKSTIFISAVLTTFALVMLYRVAAAYSSNQGATKVAAQPPTSLPATVATEPPAVADPTLGPVEAAQLASNVVGNTNLGSAESSSYNGTSAYMVTFTNHDVVYVGLDGQILSVQIAPVTPAPPIVVNVAPTKKHKNNHGNAVSAPGASSSSDNSEGHDD